MISLINYIWSQYIQEIYKFFFNLSLYSLQICKNVPWRDCGIFSRVRQKSFGASHRGHGMKPRLDFPPLCLLEYFRGPLIPSWLMNPSLILESVAVFLASSDFFSTWLSHFETKPAIDANMSEIHNEISREIRYLVSGHKKREEVTKENQKGKHDGKDGISTWRKMARERKFTCKTRLESPVFWANCFKSLASGFWLIAK